MEGGSERSALDRIVAQIDDPDIVRKLGSDLSAPDLTTLLMAIARDRASRVRASGVLARYRQDRLSGPGKVPFRSLRQIEDLFVGAVPETWSWIVPSPVVPLGTHVALGEVSQDWLVSTVRSNEVAADPTVALALEAAVARRDSAIRRTAQPTRLATIQRILRGQLYRSPDAFPHFSIFALASAGRSRPNERFDVEALNEHLSIHVSALTRIARSVEIVLSTSDTRPGRELLDGVRRACAERDDVVVSEDRGRLPGQRYYRRACFKINITVGDTTFEMADGGFTTWTELLLDDRHERLLISGAGLDRPALAISRLTGSGSEPSR